MYYFKLNYTEYKLNNKWSKGVKINSALKTDLRI